MNFTLFLIAFFLMSTIYTYSGVKEKPFFRADQQHPYHLSIGAILFDKNGHVACHHFKDILGQKDIYILMRESMEDDETPLMTLKRGLMEEFGAKAEPIAFLGSLSGFLEDSILPFDKTTLYIVCRVVEWNPADRDPNDPEAMSIIEWIDPNELISIMRQQGSRLKRIDVDESEIIKRALPYIQNDDL